VLAQHLVAEHVAEVARLPMDPSELSRVPLQEVWRLPLREHQASQIAATRATALTLLLPVWGE